jgi:hypothetical protein
MNRQNPEITLELAMANALAAVTVQVEDLNRQIKSVYLTGFNDWSTNVMAGKIENTNPPQPPYAYVVGFFTDPTNSEARWAYPQEGTEPVCPLPPVPSVPKPQAPPVLPEPPDVMKALPGDMLPAGTIITAPDGTRWQKHATNSPFGVHYYYLRVS